MASEEPRRGRGTRRDDGAEIRAAYEVVISIHGDEDTARDRLFSDRELLLTFEELRPQIAGKLTRSALRRFGPAYYFEVDEATPTASIRTFGLLAVRYSVRSTATMVDELRRFAGEIEMVIAEALDEAFRVSPEVSVELDESSVPTPAAEPETDKGGWTQLAPVLAAVATGVGVLGFVTFVGGAIEWARFHATGLPQEQALSVVPTQNLVVVGARTIVPALLIALSACAVYWVFLQLRGKPDQSGLDSSGLGRVTAHQPEIRAIYLGVVIVASEILAFTILEGPSFVEFLLFTLLGGLIAAVAAIVGHRTAKPLYLVGTVFIALSLFVASIDYIHARSSPRLRAAAVVRENKKAVIGFFVAESGGRVYLARLDAKPLEDEEIVRSSARLIGIQKEQVTDLEVGPPNPPAEALAQARTLANELCRVQVPVKSEKPKGKTAKQRTAEAEEHDCWSRPPGK